MKIEQQKELDRIQKEKKENEMKKSMKVQKKSASQPKKKDTTKSNIASIPVVTKKSSSNRGSHPQKLEKKPTMPKQGKAKFICGCFGTIHKPLANCLHCGRISCKKEGYGYCPFCSYLVDEHIIPEGEAFDKAIMHKERLLQFDRESASRTQIFDSQADYYSNSRSNWLSETEQIDAEMKEEERRKELHSRKHMLELDV